MKLGTTFQNTFLRHAVKITLFVTSSFLALNGKCSDLSDRGKISYQPYLLVPNFRSSCHFGVEQS